MHRKPRIRTFLSFGILTILAINIALSNSEMIYLQSLPANPILIDQVEFRLNRLLRYLRYNPRYIDNQELYERVKLCEIYLGEMEKQTALNYLNVLSGSANRVKGINNIILGENNKLQGCKNWVFTANYQGNTTHTLLVDRWKIDLDKI
jgi:hypothetical protein